MSFPLLSGLNGEISQGIANTDVSHANWFSTNITASSSGFELSNSDACGMGFHKLHFFLVARSHDFPVRRDVDVQILKFRSVWSGRISRRVVFVSNAKRSGRTSTELYFSPSFCTERVKILSVFGSSHGTSARFAGYYARTGCMHFSASLPELEILVPSVVHTTTLWLICGAHITTDWLIFVPPVVHTSLPTDWSFAWFEAASEISTKANQDIKVKLKCIATKACSKCQHGRIRGSRCAVPQAFRCCCSWMRATPANEVLFRYA